MDKEIMSKVVDEVLQENKVRKTLEGLDIDILSRCLLPAQAKELAGKIAEHHGLTHPVGEIHPKRTFFMRQYIGTANDGDMSWEMSILMNGVPCVQSNQTGQWFTLDWELIVDMARALGIDEQLPEKQKE